MGSAYESVSIIAYFILAAIVGVWGQHKGHSFGIGFLISLVLTFIVGAVTVFLLKDKRTGRRGIVTWIA
jgi:fructose-specific phosphotransferase system IIC component